IAIAIGTVVDMGIVLCENILKHLDEAPPDEPRREVVYRACAEVGGAVFTAVMTTIISFLPVFTMEAAEGKLFKPLAYTKTFALAGSILVALTVIPPLAYGLLGRKRKKAGPRRPGFRWALLCLTGGLVVILLARDWAPLGPVFVIRNVLFVCLSIGTLLGVFLLFVHYYPRILSRVLGHKTLFLLGNSLVLLFGFSVWLGVPRLLGWLPDGIRQTSGFVRLAHAVPGLGKEFMPDLDEGAYLLMPTTMPHASIGEVMDVLRKQDMAIHAIPEVERAVGKLGRVDSPLDPAPISMIETLITYKSEFITDEAGHLRRFEYDESAGEFVRDERGELIEDPAGRPFRQWREEIRNPEDIWEEIVRAAAVPGTTSAPKLQPIAARIVMLQSGMRAPMGLKVYGPDLETIESVALEIEGWLKQ
ncbi:MAG: efflux RND transporter permease subunit, partial [Verrucomicrobiae bacterium]|nr:efflux RND transporter permease subunit [Verrucomicrobiae bacterium]